MIKHTDCWLIRSIVAVALTLALFPACASASGASVWWPGWRIQSTEELHLGCKYMLRGSEAPAYNLARLFDGKAETAWVFSATEPEWDMQVAECRYAIRLEADKPVRVDGLCIMNGHNESLQRYRKNNRATQIRITVGKLLPVTFQLKDAPGWQSVTFAPTTTTKITIEFTGITKGPANDLCISEIELTHAGRKIEMNMPRAVMFYDGLEGCGVSYLILATGETLQGISEDGGNFDSWSPSGRYVSGIEGPDDELWFADAVEGRLITTIRKAPLSTADRKWVAGVTAKWRKIKAENRAYGQF